MRDSLHVEIVTPYEMFFEGEADSLILPAVDGEIGVMPGHSPLVVALNPGELRMTVGEETVYASISDGFAQIEIDNCIVVVGSAECPGDIDVKRAQKALERATKRYNDPATSIRERERASRGIMRAKARLKVSERTQGCIRRSI